MPARGEMFFHDGVSGVSGYSFAGTNCSAGMLRAGT
jgi:hypothetical protein